MKKLLLVFLLNCVWIFSCNNSSETKNVKSDSTLAQHTNSIDTIVRQQYSFPARAKAKNPDDTLIPEKMTAEKIIGVYYFAYGNWAFDLEITRNKIGGRMSMPDTLDEGWIGTWKIKNDTLIARYHLCSGGSGLIDWNDTTAKNKKSIEYYYSLEHDIDMMDNVILHGGEQAYGDEMISKFILVRGRLVELDGVDRGDLFPEVLIRVR